jgi:hypothetical protein
MSGTPTTFELDIEALARAGNNAGYGQHFIHDDAWLNAKYSAVIAEYQRQAAAAGLVMVRELDLAIELGVEGAHNSMEYDDAIERLHTALTNKNKAESES